MSNTRQGFLQQSRLQRWFLNTLLLLTLCLTHSASAETLVIETPVHKDTTKKHHVYIIYSPENTQHSAIIKKLSNNLQTKRADIVISTVPHEKTITKPNNQIDVIIGIGSAGMKKADKDYPQTDKLFISTDSGKYRLDSKKNKNDAILFMTQPYCRQIKFITLLNKNWQTIGILSSAEKPLNIAALQQCADKYGINIYTVETTVKNNLTNDLKAVLKRSDVLLALPDSNIYNSRTAKNILLTSYRLRKPVIAFSKNFVNAGALAAIYSSTEQIAQSASDIIEQHINSGHQFKQAINYSQGFNVSINRQVFRALGLVIPNTEEIKQTLKYPQTGLSAVVK